MTELSTLITRFTLGLGGVTRRSLEPEDGQTLAEYGLILALVAAVIVGVLLVLSGTISGLFSSASSQI
jgi:pilus assembly protein Flp/PilA